MAAGRECHGAGGDWLRRLAVGAVTRSILPPDAISADEYRALLASEKRRKYRNQPVEIDGIRFASRAEARRYGELLWQERERRELVTAGRPTIDRGWKTRQVTGAMVSVAARNRAGAE